jgi:hypothetical protein
MSIGIPYGGAAQRWHENPLQEEVARLREENAWMEYQLSNPSMTWRGNCGHFWVRELDGENCPRCILQEEVDRLKRENEGLQGAIEQYPASYQHKCQEALKQSLAEVGRLRAALEFYADNAIYNDGRHDEIHGFRLATILEDGGKTARMVLALHEAIKQSYED